MFQLDANTLDNFLTALYVLVQGMGGVFLFMGIFYLLVWALGKIFKPKTRP
ncbi:MAG: OadG-related small transporter subunit [Candidatus Cloacimonadaceae bacterium]|jgi:Na+-transporting methylmalonyl-CoA/oxaloacetate decarboxylase gamma subunit